MIGDFASSSQYLSGSTTNGGDGVAGLSFSSSSEALNGVGQIAHRVQESGDWIVEMFAFLRPACLWKSLALEGVALGPPLEWPAGGGAA